MSEISFKDEFVHSRGFSPHKPYRLSANVPRDLFKRFEQIKVKAYRILGHWPTWTGILSDALAMYERRINELDESGITYADKPEGVGEFENG